MNESEVENRQAPARSAWVAILRKAIVAVVVGGVVAGAVAVSVYWMRNRPTARRRPRAREARLVQVETVEPGSVRVVVRAMGTVTPAREIELAGRVGGEIVQVSGRFVPGGRFAAGETILKIDPEDYHLALRRAETQAAVAGAAVESAAAEIARCETDLTQAESELAIERGAQAVAAREYELLGAELDPEDRGLVLREPHLRKARAAREAAAAAKRKAEAAHASAVASREAAEIALADARLALQRTAVRMPFNAMVNNRRVNLGAQVAPGNPLALMVGTDEYWVVAAIPVDELRRIHIPDFNSDAGSAVRIHHAAAWGDGAGRTGTVERLWGDVEPEGRMARLLISVPDPLDLEAPADRRRPLILGGYVRVEIDGRTLEDVVRLDREHLRDGGQVWVMGPDDRLEIRDVAIAWSGGDDVCIDDGLADGDRLVVSDLGAAVEGMLLRTAETTTRTAGQEERP